MIRIGVDFGGTKIEAAAIDREGRFQGRARAANPREYQAALDEVRRLVNEVERQAGATAHAGVGVGAPGSISPRSGLVRNANSTWLNGRPFREDLELALGRPVRVANDANCLALSEAVDGAGAGASVVFAAVLGTGCGGGLVIDGRLVGGRNGVAGEWGHSPLPWPNVDEVPAPSCWCGQSGCMELYVSGPGFEADYRSRSGAFADAKTIVALARRGEDYAAAALEAYIDRLGRGLAVICNLVDPDIIVLGGGLSNVEELYARTPAVVALRLFSDVFETPIVAAAHGNSSGVRGAAWLWPWT